VASAAPPPAPRPTGRSRRIQGPTRISHVINRTPGAWRERVPTHSHPVGRGDAKGSPGGSVFQDLVDGEGGEHKRGKKTTRPSWKRQRARCFAACVGRRGDGRPRVAPSRQRRPSADAEALDGGEGATGTREIGPIARVPKGPASLTGIVDRDQVGPGGGPLFQAPRGALGPKLHSLDARISA